MLRFAVVIALCLGPVPLSIAQEGAATPAEAAPAPAAATPAPFAENPWVTALGFSLSGRPGELTLQTFLVQGGPILWLTLALGFIALVLALYHFFALTPGREVPKKLVKRATAQLRDGEVRAVYQMVEDREELLARVLRAGLRLAGHDRHVIKEAMESEGARGATMLWQRIAYLNNIATLSMLLGLFGTVWGMMLAFSSIHYETTQVRGLAIAGSISLAMITTAGGLAVAIPAKFVYYYLRGRVIRTITLLEAQSMELLELIVQHGPRS